MAISTMILMPPLPIIPQTSSLLDITEDNGGHATSNNSVSGRNNVVRTSLVSLSSPIRTQQSQRQLLQPQNSIASISTSSLLTPLSTQLSSVSSSIEDCDLVINSSWHETTGNKCCDGMILLRDTYTDGPKGSGLVDNEYIDDGPSYPIPEFMCSVKIMESTLGSTALPSSSLSGGSCLTKYSTASSNSTYNSFAAENSKGDDDDDDDFEDDLFDDDDNNMNKKQKKSVRFSLYDECDDSSLLSPSCIYIYENPLHILLEMEDTRDDTNEFEESPVVENDTNDENDNPNNSPNGTKKILKGSDLDCEEAFTSSSEIDKQSLGIPQQQSSQYLNNSNVVDQQHQQQQQLQAHVNSKIWWTEEEHTQIRASIKEKCSMIRSKTPSKIQELIFCFKNCRLPDGFDTSIHNDLVLSPCTNSNEKGPKDIIKNSRLLKMNDELITDILNEWVLDDDLRGLEKKMTSRFRQASVQAVTAVLDCQDLIWTQQQQQQASSMLAITSNTTNTNGTTTTSFVVDSTSSSSMMLTHDEMIRQRSMEASYRARLFAYRMALSDAKYASDVNKECRQ